MFLTPAAVSWLSICEKFFLALQLRHHSSSPSRTCQAHCHLLSIHLDVVTVSTTEEISAIFYFKIHLTHYGIFSPYIPSTNFLAQQATLLYLPGYSRLRWKAKVLLTFSSNRPEDLHYIAKAIRYCWSMRKSP